VDEPLQGTNEAERRVALRIVLRHLLAAGAVGAVATHDLALHEVDDLAGAARPVHLAGEVRRGARGPELRFDYLLRQGPATSTNALELLRAVGLGEEPEAGTGTASGA
jgi:DNA mismatch repair ATPase MutS